MSECKPYIPSRIFENPTAKCKICDEPPIEIKKPHLRLENKAVCINDNIFRILGYFILMYILTKIYLQ
jgi:hypothetical protein